MEIVLYGLFATAGSVCGQYDYRVESDLPPSGHVIYKKFIKVFFRSNDFFSPF